MPLRVRRRLGDAAARRTGSASRRCAASAARRARRRGERDHDVTVAAAGRRRSASVSTSQRLEERLRKRAAGLGEHDLAAELRQQLEELLGVSLLVEEVGAEDEIPRRAAQRAAPGRPSARARRAARCRCAPRSRAGARPRRRPSRSRARRRRASAAASDGSPSPAPSSSTRTAAHVERRRRRVGERDAARPELGPVRQELVLVERRLVDQLVGARRPRGASPAGPRRSTVSLDQSAA